MISSFKKKKKNKIKDFLQVAYTIIACLIIVCRDGYTCSVVGLFASMDPLKNPIFRAYMHVNLIKNFDTICPKL